MCDHGNFSHDMQADTRTCFACGHKWTPTAEEIAREDAEQDSEEYRNEPL